MKVLVLDGHPSPNGFVAALAKSYADGAKARGHEVQTLCVRDLSFDPVLHEGYREIQTLEPDLLRAQEQIKWCDHLFLTYPIWWGQMPAQLKGFFDRTVLPGFGFKYREDNPLWDRLLAGRSTRLVVTSDAPNFYNWLAYRNAPIRVPKQMILRFCGFKPVKVTAIGAVKGMDESARKKWLARVSRLDS